MFFRWFVHLYGLLAIIVIGSLLVLPPRASEAQENLTTTYPKTANLYLYSPLTEDQIQKLAQWDVVILHMANQLHFAPQIRELRRLNPKIKILAYIPSEEFPITQYAQWEIDPSGPWHKLLAGITPGMWLTDATGKHVAFWPGNWMLNNTNYPTTGQRWNEYLSDFVNREILSTGLWDGIFYDNTWIGISWINGGAFDANRDGVTDAPADLDRAWEDGMHTLFQLTRQKADRDVILIGNGDRGYYNDLNGIYIENFTQSSGLDWAEHMRLYHLDAENTQSPQIAVVGNTELGRDERNYRAMRYGLASALLENGYYAFDGKDSHAQIWWYDEYGARIGAPAGAATSFSGAQVYNNNEVWRRDYATGLALVNPTAETKDVDLGGEYEKLIGSQDPSVNNGAIVTSVQLPPKDGLIMLKTFRTINNAVFINGSFARFFRANGQRARNGFFAFEDNVPGAAAVYNGDLDGDGTPEKIIITGPKMEIFNNAGERWFAGYPFGGNFRGQINLALGKLNNEDTPTLVAAPSIGGQVILYNYHGGLIRDDLYPLGKKYHQGFSVALASTGPNQTSELVLGTLRGRPSEVLLYSLAQNKIRRRFSPYGLFTGGVSVAAGDFNGDGNVEIATVATYNRRPLVRTFDVAGKKLTQFNVSGLFSAKPLSVAAANAGTHDEIIILSNN